MTGIEITLLLVGIVFMIGSFLITEKLSSSELNKVSELSENEIKKILTKELEDAQQGIDERLGAAIEQGIEQSIGQVDRALEKETNEKIMAISDFSDTVMENMNKTHNEIMFLYSMLNDKHASMTQSTEDIQALISKWESQKEKYEAELAEAAADFELWMNRKEAEALEKIAEKLTVLEEIEEKLEAAAEAAVMAAESAKEPEPEEVYAQPEEMIIEPVEEEIVAETPKAKANHNALILELHKAGMSDVEIAKELGLGMGEVRLVLGLFREEEA